MSKDEGSHEKGLKFLRYLSSSQSPRITVTLFTSSRQKVLSQRMRSTTSNRRAIFPQKLHLNESLCGFFRDSVLPSAYKWLKAICKQFPRQEVQSQWTGRQLFILNTFAACFVGNFVLFCCAGLVGQGLTRTLQMFYPSTPSIKPCLNMLSRRTANHPIFRAPGKKKLALKPGGDSH